MLQEIPKRLLIINDMAGFGRCSLTVALPVASACKVHAIPVPTSIFSNHTGFASYYKKDMTVYLPDYSETLDERGLLRRDLLRLFWFSDAEHI